MGTLKDLSGRRFGTLVVENYDGRRGGVSFWRARCDCGVVKVVRHSALKIARTCGVPANHDPPAQHGHCRNRKLTPEYNSWIAARNRCNNTRSVQYPHYGGRGIRVCDRWSRPGGFERFLADMGPRPTLKHSLDRIDVNGNYEPGNCRWATRTEQSRNTRSNVLIRVNGETVCRTVAAIRLGLSVAQVRRRVANGELESARAPDAEATDLARRIAMSTVKHEWFNNHENLCALWRWLDGRGDVEVEDVTSFLEKPWKWEGERARMLAEEAGDAFMVEVTDEDGDVSTCTFRSFSHDDLLKNEFYQDVARLEVGSSVESRGGVHVKRLDALVTASSFPTASDIVRVACGLAARSGR